MTDTAKSEHDEKSRRERVVEGLREHGEKALNSARDGAEKLAEDQKSVTADYLHALATAADAGAEELKTQGHGTTAALVSNMADEFDGIVRDLGNRPVGKLVDDVADFARERPVLFFGAAFVLGLGTARFAKSSARRNQQDFHSHAASAPGTATANQNSATKTTTAKTSGGQS